MASGSVSLSRRVLRRPERGTMPNDDGEDNNGPPTQTAWSWCGIVRLAGSFIRRRRKIVALSTQTHGVISRLYPDKPLYEHMKNMSYAVHVVHLRYTYSTHCYRIRNFGCLPNFFISGFRRGGVAPWNTRRPLLSAHGIQRGLWNHQGRNYPMRRGLVMSYG